MKSHQSVSDANGVTMKIRVTLFPIIIAITLFITSLAYADELLIEPDAGRKPILDIIQQAHHSIDLVMYGFTDQQFANALIQQKENGKTIKMILEENPYKNENQNKKIIAKLLHHQIDWQGSIPPFRLIHQKTLVIDNQKAVVMTFNFTHSAFKNQRNFALIIDDPKRVREIKSVFLADWNHQTFISPHPELIFSPDHSREKILEAISHAKKNVKIYAQNINDYELIGTLAKLARKGILVEILTSSKLRDKQAHYLQKAGVNIYYSQKMVIHAKVFIIDQQKAILGSINLTRASFNDNRELSVQTEDKKVIKELTHTFDRDLKNNTAFSISESIPLKTDDIQHALRLAKKIVTHVSHSHFDFW